MRIPNQTLNMKAILCFLLAIAGFNNLLSAQEPILTSGPSFSAKDSTKADVIAVASLQAYPRSIERQTTRQAPVVEEVPIQQANTTTDSGPIRDWSNPPGYMGASGKPISTSKHKPLTPRKYHRTKSNRCYTF